jgi:hypothetical protein
MSKNCAGTIAVVTAGSMLLPGAPGDQGRPDDCAASRITHIGARNDELKTSVACPNCERPPI